MKTIADLPRHRGQICALSWSSDGERLLSASYDGEIRVWHVAANHSIILREPLEKSIGPENWLFTASWSPNNELVAASFGHHLTLLTALDGRVIREVDRPASVYIAWSLRGTLLAPILSGPGGYNSKIEELKVPSLESIDESESNIYELSGLACSADNEMIAAQAYGGIQLYRSFSLKEAGFIRLTRGVATDATWLTNQSFAMASSDGNIRIYQWFWDHTDPS